MSAHNLVILDDSRARSFVPIITTRPLCEVLAGVCSVRERWENLLGVQASGFISAATLVEFEEAGAPGFAGGGGDVPAGSIIANSRFIPSLGQLGSAREDGTHHFASPGDHDIWMAGGQVAAVRLKEPLSYRQLSRGDLHLERLAAAGTRSVEVDGVWLSDVWDLIRYLPDMLRADIAAISDAGVGLPGGAASESDLTGSARRSGVHWPEMVPATFMSAARVREIASVTGDHPVLVSSTATIDAHVVLDARGGPILIAANARIQAFSRLEGPLFVGTGSTIVGGRVARCSIGKMSKVSGEISDSIVSSFTNKAHDGFVGHSYLGSWVNIGAGTITSNLKNTYGTISLWTPTGVRNTGLQFLGSLIGDHTRLGIGMLLSTGTVVDACSNLYGREMLAGYVPPFSWGEPGSLVEYDLARFEQVTERAMSRRGLGLSDRGRRHLSEIRRRS